MINLYEYYEQPTELPLYGTLYVPLSSYFDIGSQAQWGTTIHEADLAPVLHIIQRDPQDAYQYSVRILKQRWPDAEPYIMKAPNAAYRYAKFVMRERWLKAEPIIKKDEMCWVHYRQHFNIQE